MPRSSDDDKPVRVAVICRVIHHWRAPIFRYLSNRSALTVKVFHGQSIPGTKLTNTDDFSGIEHQELKTWHQTVRSTGRAAPLVWHRSLFLYLRKWRPDVIMTEGGGNILSNIGAFLYARLFRTPVIWWSFGELKNREYRGLVSRCYHWLRLRQERASAAYLGYNTAAIAYYRQQGYPENACFLATNCVDTAAIESRIPEDRKKAAAFCGSHGLDGCQVILYCGALIAAKHPLRLVEAFAKTRSRISNARLLLVGDGPERGAIESEVTRLGLTDHVIFTGAVWDGVGQYFEAADIFVMPGLGGLAISEAMTHGLPVISGGADGTELDLIAPGETGYLLDEQSDVSLVDQLAEYLVTSLSDRQKLKSMSEAAYELIKTRVNVQNYVDNIVRCVKATHAASHRQPDDDTPAVADARADTSETLSHGESVR